MSTGNINGQSQRISVRIPHDLVAKLREVDPENTSAAVVTVLRRALKVKAPKKGAK